MPANEHRRYIAPDSTSFVPIFSNRHINDPIKDNDTSSYLLKQSLEFQSSHDVFKLSNLLNHSEKNNPSLNNTSSSKPVCLSSTSIGSFSTSASLVKSSVHQEFQSLKSLKAKLLSLYSCFTPSIHPFSDPLMKQSTISPSTIPVQFPSYSPLPTFHHGSHHYSYNNLKPTEPVKKRRSQVQNACIPCRKACKKCENSRPCFRCISRGLESQCINSERKKRVKGTPRGPYKRSIEKECITTDRNPSKQKIPVPDFGLVTKKVPLMISSMGLAPRHFSDKENHIKISNSNDIKQNRSDEEICRNIDGLLEAANSTIYISPNPTLSAMSNKPIFQKSSVAKTNIPHIQTNYQQSSTSSVERPRDLIQNDLNTLSYLCQILEKSTSPPI